MAIATHLLRLLWTTAGLNLTWRKILYRNLCNAGSSPDYSFTTDFFGLKYQGNLKNSIEAKILFYGAFEKPLLFFMRDTLINLNQNNSSQTPGTFVDVGANIGQHSLFMSSFADQVIAFEPFSEVSATLKHHISLNKITNIILEEVALSDQQETLDFFAPTGRNKGIGSFDPGTVEKGNVFDQKLQLIQGDQYFEANECHPIQLIKVDVEDFEKKVLTGLQKTLQSHRPVVVCEVSYGKELSFFSEPELRTLLPEHYNLFRFDNRNPDGSKAKKRGSKSRHSGFFRIIPLDNWRESGQDNIIAVPVEKTALIPGLGDKESEKGDQ